MNWYSRQLAIIALVFLALTIILSCIFIPLKAGKQAASRAYA